MEPCHRPDRTTRTLARLAIDLDPLIAGVIEERSEEQVLVQFRSRPAVTANGEDAL
jgi:hypothetical protein